MDYRLDCEVLLADHGRMAANVGAEGWHKPVPIPRYRVTAAQMLVALAARIAPTVAMANPRTPALVK